MDKREMQERVKFFYADEIQYALARDDEIDLTTCRARAAIRVGREMEGRDISAVWLGYVEGVARNVEASFEEDITHGQLRLGGAIRVRDLTFVPTPKMRKRDWLTVDDRHHQKLVEHQAKRAREHEVIEQIVERIDAHGGDPTTIEACPDMFAAGDEAAA